MLVVSRYYRYFFPLTLIGVVIFFLFTENPMDDTTEQVKDVSPAHPFETVENPINQAKGININILQSPDQKAKLTSPLVHTKDDHLIIDQPKVVIDNKNKPCLITAKGATSDKEHKKICFEKNVTVANDNGLIIKTPNAVLSPEKNSVAGKQGVTAEQDNMHLNANRFLFDTKTGNVKVTGQAHLKSQ